MHNNPAVILGCTDCHGGDARVDEAAGHTPRPTRPMSPRATPRTCCRAIRTPGSSRRAPIREQSYTLLNREAREFVRFVNPGDYRVAREACGACHLPTIQAAERSLMSTSAMLWGGASYNNGILPFKRYVLGEAYTDKGEPAAVVNPIKPTAFMTEKGILAASSIRCRRGRRSRPATSSGCSSAAAA